MSFLDRRGFLRAAGAGALSAALPPGIRRALAIPASSVTGTIGDVQHIVVLMQENRSFDHYFGSLRGVRGFGDPRSVFLRSGKSVWHQPAVNGDVLPFRPDAPDPGSAFLQDLAHDWNSTQDACNRGNHDRWVAAKGSTSMAYLDRAAIPFHYALADAFTVCDAYHCSVLGPTDPNRCYLWTGCCGNDGSGGGPVIDNEPTNYAWTTYPERLHRAGISWKVYQDAGAGLDARGSWGWADDAHVGNYGDNALLYFSQYRAAPVGSSLHNGACCGTNASAGDDLFKSFRQDVENDRLPQVSWIVAPEAYSEHPNWPANHGAVYVSGILDALTSNPDVWSKTVLFLTYDENDGFFDHMVPPFATQDASRGASNVDAANEWFAGNDTHVAGPYGLGPRVPMLVISPWSRGGMVNSQLFDHTSIIRFIERRFGAIEPCPIESNISAWRRSVCGDLTSAFDFSNPDSARPPLRRTIVLRARDLERCDDYVPAVPSQQAMPLQEPGIRGACALPYEFDVGHRVIADASLELLFLNPGTVGVVLQVRSLHGGPWMYTVGANSELSSSFPLPPGAARYDFAVHGPNGFMRRYKGMRGDADTERVDPEAHVTFDPAADTLTLVLSNPGLASAWLSILDNYTGERSVHTLAAGQTCAVAKDFGATFHWYDLVVSDERPLGFRRQFAGKAENGKVGVSDPALGARYVALTDDL